MAQHDLILCLYLVDTISKHLLVGILPKHEPKAQRHCVRDHGCSNLAQVRAEARRKAIEIGE